MTYHTCRLLRLGCGIALVAACICALLAVWVEPARARWAMTCVIALAVAIGFGGSIPSSPPTKPVKRPAEPATKARLPRVEDVVRPRRRADGRY